MAPLLRDSDPVDGGVQLTVAGARKTVPYPVARPHRQRRRAVVSSVRVLRAEPTNVGGLGHDLRRGEGGHTDDLEEVRSELAHASFDLSLERVRRMGEL